MSSDDKIMEGGGEGSSHDTHQAITCTIHIMAPTDLGTNAIDSALVASVEAQDTRQESDSSLLVVPGDGDDAINVSAKNIIQTVTETNIGSVDLPVISNINSDQVTEQSIELVTKDEKHVEDIIEEDIGCHCLICNEELQEQDNISVFKSFTATSQRKVSIFLGDLVGQKLTSRKTHSTIICDKCFKLLNKLDLLEFEIQETKEEIITKYQETIAAYGGRARRKKPAAAKKSDYVFPKIEPEEEDKEGIEIEGDEIYQPQVDDLLEEEQDRREDRDSLDEEWEPEVKRARIKRESNTDPNGPPKRKRGRPRKDASKTKGDQLVPNSKQGPPAPPPPTRRIVTVPAIFKKCPHCTTIFMDSMQLTSHLAQQHKDRQEERLCQRCRRRFWTYEDNTACDPCLQSLRLNAIPSRKSLEEEDVGSDVMSTFMCGHCHLTFESRVLVELHCLSTGHDMDKISHFSHKRDLKALHSSGDSKSTGGARKLDSNVRGDVSSSDENVLSENKKYIGSLRKGQKRRLIKKNQTACEVCGQEFNSVSSLYAHLRVTHPTLFPHECGVCRRRFTLEASAREHERKHAMGELQCPACPLRFSHLSHLHHHARTLHPDFTDFRCQYCNVATPTVDALQCHIKVHHGDRLGLPAAFTCKVCKESFHTGKALATHRSSRHPGTAECNICGVKVGRRYLKKHINAVHTKEKVHKCEECKTVFYSRTGLTGHQRRHHGPRKFFCESCGKGYVHNVELQRHLKAHRNQRDFKCEYCSRSFLKAVDLTYHRRSHTGEKPHQCELCPESFIRPLGLRKHMLKHTSVKKVKRLKYSKKKIDELTSSVISQNNAGEEQLESQGAKEERLDVVETDNGSLNETQPLQSFPEASLVAPNLAPSQRLQPTMHQLAPAELQVQQLSVTDLDGTQLEGQLELSQVVEDLSSGELLEMSPGLLLEATDVQVTDETIAGNVTSSTEVQGETDENSQTSQPVQVIYVVEDILNPSICYHKSIENCSKCKDNYRNYF
ncbi:uncharacterized protein [Macrobrachium rosenbergii]|uniref:uncharacterized protein isoform X2 n=1 Tax=Macrobrachium rosenbergii TaxID=79674 RepID=UPI0034D52157